MAILADLFNSSFLMFLGILVLVVALLVVYFESKMREQNHKIASMLSLVSTLAEDMNGVKMGLNHLAIRGGTNQHNFVEENLGNIQSLIEVSDDEDEEADEDEDEEVEEDEEEDEADEEESSIINLEGGYEEDSKEGSEESVSEGYLEDSEFAEIVNDELEEDTKIITLKVSQEVTSDINESYEDINNLVFEQVENLPDLELNKEENHNSEDSIMPSTSDLKTISINLGDDEQHIDYRKLQLPKLRSIAIEKGLVANLDVSKLKKHEILKLLGVE